MAHPLFMPGGCFLCSSERDQQDSGWAGKENVVCSEQLEHSNTSAEQNRWELRASGLPSKTLVCLNSQNVYLEGGERGLLQERFSDGRWHNIAWLGRQFFKLIKK